MNAFTGSKKRFSDLGSAGGEPGITGIPTKWVDAFDHLADADRFRLSWKVAPKGAWISFQDDYQVRTVAVETSDGEVNMYEIGAGPITSPEAAEQTWSDLYERYLDEKRKRSGRLKQMYVGVEFWQGEEALQDKPITCVLRPDKDRPESEDPSDQWITDPESEDDRRDRNLLREMRRERGQLFSMVRESLEMQHRQADKMGAMVETVAAAFGSALDMRERAQEEERLRILEMREGTIDDRRAELLIEKLGEFAKYAMHQQGAGVAPNAEGVDPLIADCRELAAMVTSDQWDALAALDAEIFADLRGVLDRACKWDAQRPEILAAMQAVFMEIAKAGAQQRIQLSDVEGIIGSETVQKLGSIRQHLTPQ